MSVDRLFAERFKEERVRSGLTQADLAEIADVSREMIGKYERGAAEPGSGVLVDLDRAGLDVLYVLTGRRTPRGALSLSPSEQHLLAIYSSATEPERAALDAVAVLAMNASAVRQSGASTQVSVAGDVGQSIAGNASFSAPVSFSLGSKKKKS